MKSILIEANLDGLVGPTHHYGGIGVGNEASLEHRHSLSHPRQAAMQGLAKMGRLVELGIPQAVLPPCPRPNLAWLAQQGFVGALDDVLNRIADEWPAGLSASYSSAFMWTANAATVSPATSTLDQSLHITIANLATNLHRAMEAMDRYAQLQSYFQAVPSCYLHAPLASCWPLRDEGAANHLRLAHPASGVGLEIFVDGGEVTWDQPGTRHHLPRHSRAASRSLARLHQLDSASTFFLQQCPAAIDAGVFHNDVISTAHEDLWLYHQDAFLDAEPTIERIGQSFQQKTGIALKKIKVASEQVTLKQAVKSYLFNSQLVTPENKRGADGKRMILFSPVQCNQDPSVRQLIEQWIADPSNPIEKVEYVPLDQSMANGGGPACLRLRVAMTQEQLDAVAPDIWLTDSKRRKLENWIEQWYPETLSMSDLRRAEFAQHSLAAIQNYPAS